MGEFLDLRARIEQIERRYRRRVILDIVLVVAAVAIIVLLGVGILPAWGSG